MLKFRDLGLTKWHWATVFVLWVAFALTEGAGLGMLLPVLVYVQEGSLTTPEGGEPSLVIRAVADLSEYAGLEINLVVLLIAASIPLLLRHGFLYAKNVYEAKAEHQLEADLRIRQFRPFLAANLPFFLKNNQGEIVSALLFDVTRARSIVRAVIEIMGAVILLLIYGVLALIISPILSVVALPLFVVAALIVRSQEGTFKRHGAALSEDSQKFSRMITETFQAIRLVKMRSAEREVGDQLTEMTLRLSKFQLSLQVIRSAIDAVIQPMLLLGVFGVLYIAFEFLDMGLAEMGIFLFLVHKTIPVVTNINMNRLIISSSIESFQRIQELRDEATTAAEPVSGSQVFEELREGVRFEDVSFSYVREGSVVEALKNVSFDIEKGKMVALVGPSGAGKSTTVDLITRFYDASGGEISVDGVPIGQYDLGSLRRGMAFVTQEPAMFHDTIRANICFGLDEEVSEERLRDCLRRSHCIEFVDPLPDGIETVIGERGLRLSGGQRQRLALARALVQKPQLLILDEPTSALDSVSEAEIHASLEELRGDVTIIVIAHRLATIRSADVILVLDDGHLVAQGTHATLQEKVGTYRQLVEMQQL